MNFQFIHEGVEFDIVIVNYLVALLKLEELLLCFYHVKYIVIIGIHILSNLIYWVEK